MWKRKKKIKNILAFAVKLFQRFAANIEIIYVSAFIFFFRRFQLLFFFLIFEVLFIIYLFFRGLVFVYWNILFFLIKGVSNISRFFGLTDGPWLKYFFFEKHLREEYYGVSSDAIKKKYFFFEELRRRHDYFKGILYTVPWYFLSLFYNQGVWLAFFERIWLGWAGKRFFFFFEFLNCTKKGEYFDFYKKNYTAALRRNVSGIIGIHLIMYMVYLRVYKLWCWLLMTVTFFFWFLVLLLYKFYSYSFFLFVLFFLVYYFFDNFWLRFSVRKYRRFRLGLLLKNRRPLRTVSWKVFESGCFKTEGPLSLQKQFFFFLKKVLRFGFFINMPVVLYSSVRSFFSIVLNYKSRVDIYSWFLDKTFVKDIWGLMYGFGILKKQCISKVGLFFYSYFFNKFFLLQICSDRELWRMLALFNNYRSFMRVHFIFIFFKLLLGIMLLTVIHLIFIYIFFLFYGTGLYSVIYLFFLFCSCTVFIIFLFWGSSSVTWWFISIFRAELFSYLCNCECFFFLLAEERMLKTPLLTTKERNDLFVGCFSLLADGGVRNAIEYYLMLSQYEFNIYELEFFFYRLVFLTSVIESNKHIIYESHFMHKYVNLVFAEYRKLHLNFSARVGCRYFQFVPNYEILLKVIKIKSRVELRKYINFLFRALQLRGVVLVTDVPIVDADNAFNFFVKTKLNFCKFMSVISIDDNINLNLCNWDSVNISLRLSNIRLKFFKMLPTEWRLTQCVMITGKYGKSQSHFCNKNYLYDLDLKW